MDSITVDVLSNDSDVDGNPLTITHVERPGHHGLVVLRSPSRMARSRSLSGQLVFTPAANYHGPAIVHVYDHRRDGLGGGDGHRHRHPGQ